MPVNRYSLPAEQPVMSTYAPLPYEELMYGAKLRQDKYNRNAEEFDKAKGLINSIKSIEEHDPYRNAMVKNFNDKAQALVNQYPDMGTEDFRRRTRDLLYEFANNPNLQILSRSLENKKNRLKDIEELKKQGKYGEYNDPGSILDNQFRSGTNPFIDQAGNPVEYRHNPIYSTEDHAAPVHELFSKVKDSGEIRKYFNIDPRTGDIISVKKGYEGVGRNTLRKIVYNPETGTENVSTFLDSNGGKDFIRQWRNRNPNGDKKQLLRDATNHMYNIAEAYIRGKVSNESDYDYSPDYIRGALQDEIAFANAPTYETQASDNPLLENLPNFDASGNVIPEKNKVDPEMQRAAAGGGGFTGLYPNNKVSLTEDQKKVNATVDNLLSMNDDNGNKLFANRKEAVEAWKSAHENHKNVSTLYWDNSVEKKKSISPQTLKEGLVNIGNRSIALIAPKEDGGGSYSTRNGWDGVMQTIKDKYGDEAEISSSTVEGMSKANQYGMSGAEVVSITVKDKDKGIHHMQMLVSPTKEVSQAMNPVNIVSAPYYQGKVGRTVIDGENGTKVIVDVVPKKQSDGSYKFAASVIYDRDGKQSKPRSLEQFAKDYRDQNQPLFNSLLKSNFILDKDQE